MFDIPEATEKLKNTFSYEIERLVKNIEKENKVNILKLTEQLRLADEKMDEQDDTIEHLEITLQNEIEGSAQCINDLNDILKDYRRLARELDVELHGEGAASQASLCDLIGSIKAFKEKAKPDLKPGTEFLESTERQTFMVQHRGAVFGAEFLDLERAKRYLTQCRLDNPNVTYIIVRRTYKTEDCIYDNET